MANNDFVPHMVPRAPIGSKRGWPTISGQVPPIVATRLIRFAARHQICKGDVLHAALELYLDREAA